MFLPAWVPVSVLLAFHLFPSSMNGSLILSRTSGWYFLSLAENTYYLPKTIIKVGHHRPTIETPFKWCFAGGPIVAKECLLAGPLPMTVVC